MIREREREREREGERERERENGDWTGKVQIMTKKKFVAVGEACRLHGYNLTYSRLQRENIY